MKKIKVSGEGAMYTHNNIYTFKCCGDGAEGPQCRAECQPNPPGGARMKGTYRPHILALQNASVSYNSANSTQIFMKL